MLQVAGYPLHLSGSVGLDKTLDFLVELPFTEQLVHSKDLYELLEGETLKVRVGGTVDQRQINKNIVRDNISSLLRQAPLKLLRKRLQ